MTDLPDAVYEGLRARDPSALDHLVADYISPVLHLAQMILGRVGGPEDAEEIASDVFAAVWERIAEYDPARTGFRSWVLMLTKYTALDRRRRLMRQQYTADGEARAIPLQAAPSPEAPESPEGELLRRDRQDRLHRALDRLPPADRELLVRRYFLEEPIADLAREAGVSRSAIDNRLWRARQALKALLNENGEVDEHGHEAL